MKCGLVDIRCHVTQAAVDWWTALGWGVQAIILLGLALIAAGVLWSLWGLLKSIYGKIKLFGGWPAVAGAGVVLFGLVLAFLPKKQKLVPTEEIFPDPDGPLLKSLKKKHRPTIFGK